MTKIMKAHKGLVALFSIAISIVLMTFAKRWLFFIAQLYCVIVPIVLIGWLYMPADKKEEAKKACKPSKLKRAIVAFKDSMAEDKPSPTVPADEADDADDEADDADADDVDAEPAKAEPAARHRRTGRTSHPEDSKPVEATDKPAEALPEGNFDEASKPAEKPAEKSDVKPAETTKPATAKKPARSAKPKAEATKPDEMLVSITLPDGTRVENIPLAQAQEMMAKAQAKA